MTKFKTILFSYWEVRWSPPISIQYIEKHNWTYFFSTGIIMSSLALQNKAIDNCFQISGRMPTIFGSHIFWSHFRAIFLVTHFWVTFLGQFFGSHIFSKFYDDLGTIFNFWEINFLVTFFGHIIWVTYFMGHLLVTWA